MNHRVYVVNLKWWTAAISNWKSENCYISDCANDQAIITLAEIVHRRYTLVYTSTCMQPSYTNLDKCGHYQMWTFLCTVIRNIVYYLYIELCTLFAHMLVSKTALTQGPTDHVLAFNLESHLSYGHILYTCKRPRSNASRLTVIEPIALPSMLTKTVNKAGWRTKYSYLLVPFTASSCHNLYTVTTFTGSLSSVMTASLCSL